jgi:hypothetical protein
MNSKLPQNAKRFRYVVRGGGMYGVASCRELQIDDQGRRNVVGVAVFHWVPNYLFDRCSHSRPLMTERHCMPPLAVLWCLRPP